MNRKIELNNEQKIKIMKRCFEVSKTIGFCGKNSGISVVNVSDVGDFKLKNETIKKLSKVYLKKYSSPEEKSSYDKHIEELKSNYEEYLLIANNCDYKKEYTNKQIDRILRYARKYCAFVLNMTDNELKIQFHKKGKYVSVMDDILKLDKEEIITYFDNILKGDRNAITDLRTNISHYISVYHSDLCREKKEELETSLKTRINIYSNYLIQGRLENESQRQKTKDLELLPMIKELMKELSESDMTIKEFLKKHDITMGKYKYYLKILSTYDVGFTRTRDKRNAIKNDNYFEKHNDLVYDLLTKLINGVKTSDNNVRPFDILDYYLTFGVPLEELICSINSQNCNIVGKDYHILRRFIASHNNDSLLDVDQILNTNTEINAKKDSNGFPIPGTGRLITKEERENIIMYLNENNVPLTIRTYNIALKRYIDETINLDKNTDKILKKV